MKSKLAMSEITTKNWTFEEDVRHYAALGFDAISVWRDKLAACGLERGIEILQEHQLPVANLLAVGGYTVKTKEEIEANITDTIEAIGIAERLGADCLLAALGFDAAGWPSGLNGRTVAEAEERAVAALRRLAPVAQDHGVKLALECHHPMYIDYPNTIPEVMRLVERVDHPSVGLLLDVYHVWQEENLLDHIRQAGDRIFAVHLSDWRDPTRSLNDRMVPGKGIIPWKPILQTIEATGYQGYYEIEIFSEDLWESDYVDLLRRCQEGFAAIWT